MDTLSCSRCDLHADRLYGSRMSVLFGFSCTIVSVNGQCKVFRSSCGYPLGPSLQREHTQTDRSVKKQTVMSNCMEGNFF